MCPHTKIYDPRGILPLQQNYLAKSFRSLQRGEITLSKRTPGTGNYQIPSDFGNYVLRPKEDQYDVKWRVES